MTKTSADTKCKLAALEIEQIAEAKDYLLFGRGGCVAMVHGSSIGSSGYMTDKGLAYLFWRDGKPWLVSKGSEMAAQPEQVAEIQRFSEDLKSALETAAE